MARFNSSTLRDAPLQLLGDAAWFGASRRNPKPFHAAAQETVTPLAGRVGCDVQACGNLLVSVAISAPQDDIGALCQAGPRWCRFDARIPNPRAADLIERTEALGGDASAPRRLLADGAHEAAVQAGWDALRKAERTGASSSGAVPWETVVDTQVDLPASTRGLPGLYLGLTYVGSPLDLPLEDVSVKTLDVDVPEGTTALRVAYEDVTPEGAAAGRSSAVAILDPEGEQVGGIWSDFEGSVVLRPDPLPSGTWQVRLVQTSGTPGMYDVTVQLQ